MKPAPAAFLWLLSPVFLITELGHALLPMVVKNQYTAIKIDVLMFGGKKFCTINKNPGTQGIEPLLRSRGPCQVKVEGFMMLIGFKHLQGGIGNSG